MGVLVTEGRQWRPWGRGCSVPRVRLRLKGALSFGALCHRRGSTARNETHVNCPSPASAPPDSPRGLPRAAHLDSNEDTGFSTELLRSQGFRPASVNSDSTRRASALGGRSGAPSPCPCPTWRVQSCPVREVCFCTFPGSLRPRRPLRGCGWHCGHPALPPQDAVPTPWPWLALTGGLALSPLPWLGLFWEGGFLTMTPTVELRLRQRAEWSRGSPRPRCCQGSPGTALLPPSAAGPFLLWP